MDMDNSVVIAGGEGDKRVLNSNGKIIQLRFNKKTQNA